MKKGLIAIGVVLGVLALVVVLAPSKVASSHVVLVERPISAFERLVFTQLDWSRWWPGKKVNSETYSWQQQNLHLDNVLITGFYGSFNADTTYRFNVQFSPSDTIQTKLGVVAAAHLGSNPITKLKRYWQHRRQMKAMEALAVAMKQYFEDDKRLYGMNVRAVKVQDSVLTSTRRTFDHYPATDELYSMVGALETYIASQNAKQMNPPMLNVYQAGSQTYEVMVAIPTSRGLPPTEAFDVKHMVLGNILEGEVRGGGATAELGMVRMAEYALDYRKVAPAIPFQQLVTNRSKTSDTTQWVTRIYHPIFN